MAGVKGRSGRKRTPMAVPQVTAKPAGGGFSAPEPPEYLTDGARTEWGRAVDALRASGVSTAVDQAAMAMFCEQFVLWRQAVEHVHANGLVMYRDNGNAMANPSVAIANQAHDRMERIIKALSRKPDNGTGMTPGAPITNRFALIRGGGAV